jgi:hypothetical protein
MNVDNTVSDPLIEIPKAMFCRSSRSTLAENLTDLDWSLHAGVTMVMHAAWRGVIDKDERFIKDHGGFNCHAIARAWSLHSKKLKYVDGYFLGVQEVERDSDGRKVMKIRGCLHSWLLTPDGAIIDPYPANSISYGALLIPNKESIMHPFCGGVYQARNATEILKGDTIYSDPRRVWRKARVFAKVLDQAKALASFETSR